MQYTDTKRGIDVTRNLQAHCLVRDRADSRGLGASRGDAASRPRRSPARQPATQARHQPLPPAALDKKRYAAWTKDFAQWVARAQPLTVYTVPAMKLVSKPEETERDFQARIQLAGRETRDAAVEKLRERYAPKVARLQEKARKAEEAVGKEQQQASQQKLQTAVSLGATMLGALMGRRAVSLSTLGRATTAARGVGRSAKETQDVAQARRSVCRKRRPSSPRSRPSFRRRSRRSRARSRARVAIETIEIKPKRGGVEVRIVALAWKPSA